MKLMAENNKLIAEWGKFSHFLKRKEIPAKTSLLQEGQISKTAYFIEKGCVRSWFNNLGKDITFQFFLEGEGVASIESFVKDRPSTFSLETIEPSVILCISKIDLEQIIGLSPILKKDIEKHILHRLLHYQELFLSRIKDNPQKRYEELIRHRPEILQRIPQHYIASYLGITPVSLSRIRNRR